VNGDSPGRLSLLRRRNLPYPQKSRFGYLVSWNFKHLANVRREAGFNAVNVLQGYPPVRIISPTFLIHGHEEKTF
jgi:hypothetical protein